MVRRRSSRWLVPALLATGALALGGVVAAPAIAQPARTSSRITTIPVSFRVRNVNRSDVPCAADGRTYTVRGDIVAPAVTPKDATITVYLHGLGFGEYFWNFRAVKGYDYAHTLARAGQTSLIVNRLGYGDSGKPQGNGSCAGSQATVAHELIQDVRDGHYAARHVRPRSYRTVFLAGHSFGGLISQIEAYSFHDVDGLVVISYTDTGATKLQTRDGDYTAKVCAAGGRKVTPGGPGGYAPFGPKSLAKRSFFHDVSPAVYRAAAPKLSLNPCGDTASVKAATAVDEQDVKNIHVPVLLVQGASDALFDAGRQGAEKALYTGSPDLRTALIAHSGHAITLQRTRLVFARLMERTLERFERR